MSSTLSAVPAVLSRLVPGGNFRSTVNSADSAFGINSLPNLGIISIAPPSSNKESIITRPLLSSTLPRNLL